VAGIDPVKRILVSTDRSPTADYAVEWAADMASRYEAELLVLQVQLPGQEQEGVDDGLREFVSGLSPRARPSVVVDPNPADAIVRAAEEERADVLVVGNVGMSGRKEFLLGNVPNRVSHNARCTVVIVNTAHERPRRRFGRKR
jgi:ubiquinone biosynthesis protein